MFRQPEFIITSEMTAPFARAASSGLAPFRVGFNRVPSTCGSNCGYSQAPASPLCSPSYSRRRCQSYGDNMSYQIEIHGYDNDADAREEAQRISRCKVDGVSTIIWLSAGGYVIDHFDPSRGWDVGSTEPEDDAKHAFSLLIELDAETEGAARSITETFCAEAKVAACSLLRGLESGVDQYDVRTGWRDGPNEEAEH
jgi:hypothetical protein